MQQGAVELGALAGVDSQQTYLAAKAGRVNGDCFEIYPQVWEFFEQYAKDNPKGVPSRELIKAKFNLDLPEKRDEEFYIKELLRRDLKKRTSNVLQDAAKLILEEKAPEEVVGFLMAESAHLRRSNRLNRSVTDGDALRRF